MSKRKRKVRKKEMGALLPVAPRNPLFNHPLMKKSHVHEKSYKSKRRTEKVKGARDWYSQNGFNWKTLLKIPVTSIILNMQLSFKS